MEISIPHDPVSFAQLPENNLYAYYVLNTITNSDDKNLFITDEAGNLHYRLCFDSSQKYGKFRKPEGSRK